MRMNTKIPGILLAPILILSGVMVSASTTVQGAGNWMALPSDDNSPKSGEQTLTAVSNAAANEGRNSTPYIITGLVSWWRAEGDGIDCADANDGSLMGGVSFVPGKVGQAFHFDGSDDYMSFDNTIGGDFSIAAWIRTSDTGGVGEAYQGKGIVWSDIGGVASDMIPMALAGDRLAFGTGGTSYDTLFSSSSINTGNWLHAVVTRTMSTGEKKMYINGILESVSNGTTSLLDANAEIHVGGNTLDGRYFNGEVDELAFYNRCLSPAEVKTMSVRPTGALMAWGKNTCGQLGDGTNTDSPTPVPVAGLSSDFQAVSAGLGHSLALKSDGTVWSWGSNSLGQLGNGTWTHASTPVHVTGISDVVALSAGDTHSLALKSDGTVWAWGDNYYQQLGDGTTTNRGIPVQVTGLTNVVAISAGQVHSLALKSDGTIWAWGHNGDGRLGDGTEEDTSTPVPVSQATGLTDVVAIASGARHSLAIDQNGAVWAWGYNGYGQLGNGTASDTIDELEPVQVNELPSGIMAIASGYFHGLALDGDGQLWVWGSNEKGQLGDGTNIHRSLPVKPKNSLGEDFTGIATINAVHYYSMAIKEEGTIWGWGYNSHGELGDGTTNDTNTPVQVTGITRAIAVDAGGNHSLALVDVGKPEEVWVDDDWTAMSAGDQTDGGHVYGVDAFSTIQDGIDAVASPGVVRVADGLYVENVSIIGLTGVTLLGGYSSATWLRNARLFTSTINGNGADITVSLLQSDGAMVDGFEITGGDGAGFRIVGSPDCIIKDNRIHDIAGDGIYIEGHGVCDIAYNVISGNAGWGVNGTDARLANNIIAKNGTGGVYLQEPWIPEPSGSEIIAKIYTNTVVENSGPGIKFLNPIMSPNPEIPIGSYFLNNIVWDNKDSEGKQNSLINVDVTYSDIGLENVVPIYVYFALSPHRFLLSQTYQPKGIAGWEYSKNLFYAFDEQVPGSIPVWQYHAEGPHRFMYVPWASGSTPPLDISGWTRDSILFYAANPGHGNICESPKFMDQQNGDFRLRFNSPCIDRGLNIGDLTTDFEGGDRCTDGTRGGEAIVDMGADETGDAWVYNAQWSWRQDDWLYDDLQKGDILIERTEGFFMKLTEIYTGGDYWGHVGIYVGDDKIVHATGDGVIMQGIDSFDYNVREVVAVLRVNTSQEKREAAAEWAKGHIGDAYYLHESKFPYDHFFIPPMAPSWYCSELVWAAYLNQGVNIEDTPDSYMVRPQEIWDYTGADIIGGHWPNGAPFVRGPLELPPGPKLPANYMVVSTLSPVDVEITDPDGLKVGIGCNGIPRATHVVDDFDDDGHSEQIIVIPERKVGEYTIAVTLKPEAQPTDNYGIIVQEGDQVITLADNVPVEDIRNNYVIDALEDGTIQASPVADAEGPRLAEVGSQVTFDGSGSYDPDGTNLQYDWDYGDGSCDQDANSIVTHIYTMAGVYKVTLTVTDEAGSSNLCAIRYAVIYDSSAGFVTGGGWIESPEGAYVANSTLKGKANFGFVSKYQKGAATPTGKTEFHFDLADLNFHSDIYQWLVIAGARAMYKGTGTINGGGNYGFILSAIDAALTPSSDRDLFRIKIWDKDNVDVIVYDNQLGAAEDEDPVTQIGGGNIVIHK